MSNDALINIYGIVNGSETVLYSVPITSGAVKEEELMKSNFIRLSWRSIDKVTLPVGAYIKMPDNANGIKYRLFDKYIPRQRKESMYENEPEFQHPTMWLGRIPALMLSGEYTLDQDRDTWNDAIKSTQWNFYGPASTIIEYVANFIYRWGVYVDTDFGAEFGVSYNEQEDGWECSISSSIKDKIISLSVDTIDLLSLCNKIADACESEYLFDFANHILYFGNLPELIETTPVTLKVGNNVTVANVLSKREKYYNAFIVHGGTNNMSQETPSGYERVTRRLSLDEDTYPSSIIYVDGHSNEPKLVGELIYDDIYPKTKLYIYGLTQRIRYRRNEQDELTDEVYSTWYFELAYYTTTPIVGKTAIRTETVGTTTYYWYKYILDDSDRIKDVDLEVSFLVNTEINAAPNPLVGYTFKVFYYKEATSEYEDNVDGQEHRVYAGTFRIEFTELDGVVIPTSSTDGICPHVSVAYNPSINNNIVSLIGVVMSDDIVAAAQAELATQALSDILRLESDLNTYTFKSEPSAFRSANTTLSLAQTVVYSDGQDLNRGIAYTLTTYIRKLTTRLDNPYNVEISVGNENSKGVIQSLKEQVENITMLGKLGGVGEGKMAIMQTTGSSANAVMSQAATTQELNKISKECKEFVIGFYAQDTISKVYIADFNEITQAAPDIKLTLTRGSNTYNHTFEADGVPWTPEDLKTAIESLDEYNDLVNTYLIESIEVDEEDSNKLLFTCSAGYNTTDIATVLVCEIMANEGGNPISITTSEDVVGYDFFTTPSAYHGVHNFVKDRRTQGKVYIDYPNDTMYYYKDSYVPLGTNIEVDSALSSTSENPVQNKVIYTALQNKANTSALTSATNRISTLEGRFNAQGKALQAEQADSATNATNATNATTATNLANKPTASVSGNQINITVGGKTSDNFTVPFATKAQKDEDGNDIKAAYLKKNDATFVRYDDLQELSAGEKGVARLNIDSENLVCGYYAKGFTTNIYFTQMDGGSPTRSGVVNVYRDHHNLLWSIEYPSGTTSWDVIALVATYINNVAGYSATYDLNPPTQAYHAIITITGTSEAVEDIQFQSGFTGYVFTLEVEGAAAGFYSDANFEHLLTNSYVARKLYLDLGHNTLYCGNENELQPVTGSPIVNATYDSATGNVTLWFSAETSLTIPLAGIIPTYTAGKGISIQGNAIGLNYLVVTQDEMDDYIASGVDDGLIRYVYEDE